MTTGGKEDSVAIVQESISWQFRDYQLIARQRGRGTGKGTARGTGRGTEKGAGRERGRGERRIYKVRRVPKRTDETEPSTSQLNLVTVAWSN